MSWLPFSLVGVAAAWFLSSLISWRPERHERDDTPAARPRKAGPADTASGGAMQIDV